MFLARRHRNAVATGLATVLLLAALAPALARGLAHAQGRVAPWRVLCSAAPDGQPRGNNPAGVPRASPWAGTTGQTNGDGVVAQLLQHCPLCQAGADTPGLPGGLQQGAAQPWPAMAVAPRPTSPEPLARRPAWVSTQPRAPPVCG